MYLYIYLFDYYSIWLILVYSALCDVFHLALKQRGPPVVLSLAEPPVLPTPHLRELAF